MSVMQDSPELKASYDAATGFYNYILPNDGGFSMNAPLGSISNYQVTVKTLNGAVISRYCEDNSNVEVPEAEENGKSIVQFTADKEAGYCFAVKSDTMGKPRWESCRSRLSFIVKKADSPTNMSLLKAPYGFEIGEITLNGKSMDISDKKMMILTEDGDYDVSFYPVKVEGAGNYTVSFKRDTTAPYMIFSEDISGGEIKGTIFFHPSEADAEVKLYRNGKEVQRVPDGISAGGNYHIEVSDSLRNRMDYYFSVKSKASTPILLYAAGIIALAAVGAIIYLKAKRKLRVL